MTLTRFVYEPAESNEECEACGADLGPSGSFPWHWPEDDCRAVREPLEGPTIVPRVEVSS